MKASTGKAKNTSICILHITEPIWWLGLRQASQSHVLKPTRDFLKLLLRTNKSLVWYLYLSHFALYNEINSYHNEGQKQSTLNLPNMHIINLWMYIYQCNCMYILGWGGSVASILEPEKTAQAWVLPQVSYMVGCFTFTNFGFFLHTNDNMITI